MLRGTDRGDEHDGKLHGADCRQCSDGFALPWVVRFEVDEDRRERVGEAPDELQTKKEISRHRKKKKRGEEGEKGMRRTVSRMKAAKQNDQAPLPLSIGGSEPPSTPTSSPIDILRIFWPASSVSKSASASSSLRLPAFFGNGSADGGVEGKSGSWATGVLDREKVSKSARDAVDGVRNGFLC
jgi:hypothetical protein